MKLENKISFGAKFINNINVGKLNKNSYIQDHVSFIEINPFNPNDIKALENIAKYWEHDKFAGNIYIKAKELSRRFNPEDASKIYALTCQMSNFEKLIDTKILGVTDGFVPFRNKKYINLDHLQVNPDFIYGFKKEYKGNGTSILNCLKNIYNRISLISLPSFSVKNFYIKNEFVEFPLNSNKFEWVKNVLDERPNSYFWF